MLRSRPYFALDADLLARYGLTAQPFAPPEQYEHIYKNVALDMLANSIKQQLLRSDQIQIVKGEAGIGKTCLCRRLIYEAGSDACYHYIEVTKKTKIEDIFKVLCPDNTKSIGVHQLATDAAKQVFHYLSLGVQAVLIVDDADALTDPVFRMLFRFVESISKQNRGTLKLLLLGAREIEQQIQALQKAVPADELMHSSQLRPLSQAEIPGYLDFRFQQAGCNKHPLNKSTLTKIISTAGGVPGNIEKLTVKRLSATGYNKKLLSLYAGIAIATVATILVVSQQAEDTIQTSHTEITNLANDDDTQVLTNALSNAEQLTVTNAISEQVSDTDSVSNDMDSAQQITEEQSGLNTTNKSHGVKGTDWLKQWPQDYWVLQLTASSNIDKLSEIAESISLDGEIVIHSTIRNGDPWFVLLYGVFPDVASARQAVTELPTELQTNKPWPRPLESIITY